MNETHSRAIVILLALILGVMLFGASTVLTTLGWLGGIGMMLAAVYLIVIGLVKSFNWFLATMRDEVIEAREEQRPWRLWLLILLTLPGLMGLWAVAGAVRYWWIPITMSIAFVAVVITLILGRYIEKS